MTLALLLSVAGVPKALANRLPLLTSPLLAQSTPPFPLQPSVSPETTVKIEGSTSMTIANTALKQKFESQYAGTTVDVKYTGTDEGIQALLAGNVDLAAIGRPLTDAEKAQGLVEIPVSRNKIAILVGEENAFQGSLTTSQFAQIFRGEITDWSQVGGAPGAIRVVDRPVSSDTRTAFSRYPVFKNRPFESATSAVKLTDDTTATVLKELGSDGIGYAIANPNASPEDYPGARIVPMHDVLPSDQRYPFSQPLAYVYQGTAPSPAAATFLGLATAAIGQAAIGSAQAAAIASDPATNSGASPAAGTSPADQPLVASVTPDPNAVATPDPNTDPNTVVTQAPAPVATLPPDSADTPSWLGWLLLPLLGLLLGWWLKRRRTSVQATTSPLPTESVSVEPPPNTTDGAGLAERAGSVISADRVAINGVNGGNHPETSTTQSSTSEPLTSEPLTSEPLTSEPLTSEPSGEVPASEESQRFGVSGLAMGAAAGAAAIAGLSAIPRRDVPVEANPWDDEAPLPEESTPEAVVVETEGSAQAPLVEASVGQEPKVEEPVSPVVQEPVVQEPIAEVPIEMETSAAEASVPTPIEESASEEPLWNTDLADVTGVAGAAIAGAAITSRFTPSSPSPSSPSPSSLSPSSQSVQPPSATLDDAQSAVEAARFDVGQNDLTREELAAVDVGLPDLPDGYGESQIVLIPRDPHWAYAYWDVPQSHREEVRRQGGTRLALRLYDVTDIDLTVTNSHSLQQFECEEFARDWYLPVPVSDRDYRAEIGYLTADGQWLLLARSLPIRIPPVYPSDWVDDQEITLNWDDTLKDKTFLELSPPRSSRTFQTIPTTYHLAQAAEAQRVAGSIFGSVQQVPSVSSFVTQSGVGMSGVGMSGVGIGMGMSGVGMSGVGIGMGMSGVGMSGIGIGMGMSGVGMSGVGIGMGMSGVGMSGVGIGMGMSGVGMSGVGIGMGMSGVGMSGIGMMSGQNMSGIGMSGIGMMSGIGFASIPPIRPRQFWLVADAELIVYGATEPDAKLTIGGQPIQLNPDGTFRIQLSFQDGVLDFPIMAIAADGEQNRSVHLNFKRETPSRNTNTKEEAQDEWGNWGI